MQQASAVAAGRGRSGVRGHASRGVAIGAAGDSANALPVSGAGEAVVRFASFTAVGGAQQDESEDSASQGVEPAAPIMASQQQGCAANAGAAIPSARIASSSEESRRERRRRMPLL